jgi:S-adenosylmethionine:tRNA ribosyltransferase-isomerase
VRTADFDYALPPRLIAQAPVPERTQSRLMVVVRSTRIIETTTFTRFPAFLCPGDLLVLNDSRVIPARLHGRKSSTGTAVEVLLVEPAGQTWLVLLRPGKRLRPGSPLVFEKDSDQLHAILEDKRADGLCRLRFDPGEDVLAFAERHGEMPLPPYISRETPDPADRERYQTVYASAAGSVAAPTAGLHFSTELLDSLRAAGVETCAVTLHVGPGTFAPVRSERVEDHAMHAERFVISEPAADAIERARAENRRVIAVGTTALRVMEAVARRSEGRIVAGHGRTDLFLHPPSEFAVVSGLLTNFHLPRSTLLMLVCAFASPGSTSGRELILGAYSHAIHERFRFYSYGDAMLLL